MPPLTSCGEHLWSRGVSDRCAISISHALLARLSVACNWPPSGCRAPLSPSRPPRCPPDLLALRYVIIDTAFSAALRVISAERYNRDWCLLLLPLCCLLHCSASISNCPNTCSRTVDQRLTLALRNSRIHIFDCGGEDTRRCCT